MAYEIKNSKFYKKYSGTPLGEIKNNKIYKYASGTPLGEVKNNKIYQYARGNPLAEVKNIKKEIAGSNNLDDNLVVACYHFLAKSLF